MKEARRVFHEIRPAGWREGSATVRQGGQATVCVVEHDNGRKGVFRYLKNPDAQATDRFFRELRILTDPQFRHPSIVNVLDYTKDMHPWYISELGTPFETYWDQQRGRLKDSPEELVRLAIRILEQILEGLAPLHDAGVVHRDIKPANIIRVQLDNGSAQPVLIDFGVAYVKEESRITNVGEAVGNLRYSPDVMMNRMDTVPPWLDIFQLSQLLIWMLCRRSVKEWQRPLDWRWVNYDDRLSDDLVISMRAVTALCSEQSISPRNATEFLRLLRERFISPLTDNPPETGVNISRIKRGTSRGLSHQDIKMAEDKIHIETCYPAISQVYHALREEVDRLFTRVIEAGVAARKVGDSLFEDYRNRLLSTKSADIGATLYEVELGSENSQNFHFRVHAVAYLPSLREHMSGPRPPASSNIFTLALQCYANLSRVTFPHKSRVLTLERTGELIMRDEQMRELTKTTVPEVCQRGVKPGHEWANQTRPF